MNDVAREFQDTGGAIGRTTRWKRSRMSETSWNLQTNLSADSSFPRLHTSFFSISTSSSRLANCFITPPEFPRFVFDGSPAGRRRHKHHHPGKEVSDHSRQEEG